MEISEKIKNIAANKIVFAKWSLLGILCLVYLLRTNSIFQFEGGDNAHYLLLAKALAVGEGYRDIFRPGAPPHTLYPPLFPLMLAGVIALHGMDMYLMKMVVSLGAAVSLILTCLLLRRRSFAMPFASVIWLGCSYKFFSQCDQLLTETVFIAFSTAALISCDKWLKDGSRKYAALAVIACGAAEMTRTVGVTVALTIGVATLLKKEKLKTKIFNAIIITILCLAPAFAWTARNIKVSGVASNYLTQLFADNPYNPEGRHVDLTGLEARSSRNIKAHFLDTAGMVGANLKVFPKPVMALAAALLWTLIVIGFYHRTTKGFGITEIFTVFFLGVVIAWPFLGYRFMMPVYPFLFAYAVEGANYLSKGSTGKTGTFRKSLKAFFAALFLAVLIINIIVSIIYQRSIFKKFEETNLKINDIYLVATQQEYDHLLEASDWLAHNSSHTDIVMTRNSRLVALASNNKVIDCPTVIPNNPKEWLMKNGVRYILMDEIYPDSINFVNALTAGQSEPPGLIVRFQIGYTAVIEITPAFFSYGNTFIR